MVGRSNLLTSASNLNRPKITSSVNVMKRLKKPPYPKQEGPEQAVFDIPKEGEIQESAQENEARQRTQRTRQSIVHDNAQRRPSGYSQKKTQSRQS